MVVQIMRGHVPSSTLGTPTATKNDQCSPLGGGDCCEPQDNVYPNTGINIAPIMRHHTENTTNSLLTGRESADLGGVKRKHGKKVSFNSRVSGRRHTARSSFTAQEVKSAWFSREEVSDIRSQCAKEIKRKLRGKSFDDETHCFRGLESYLPDANTIKLKNRATAIRAVLEEQTKQLEMQDVFNDTSDYGLDDEAIRIVYFNASSSSSLWAQLCGIHDAHDAGDILSDMEKTCLQVVDTKAGNNVSRCVAKAA